MLKLLKNYQLEIALIVAALFCGIVMLQWEFWLVFGIVVYLALLIYFSQGFRDLVNIHAAALSLIVLYAFPSTILILQGEIPLSNDESLRLFSVITIGLIGYACGALFLRKSFSFKKKESALLSQKLNTLFWLTYKYRYVLALISGIVILFSGFMQMSYKESINYRMETPGVVIYFSSLIQTVFSVVTIAMISIIGDVKKYGKLSLLSYFLIVMVGLSIVGGAHRSLTISLFACLILVFQPYLKRRYVVLIGALSIVLIFVISGGIRYARYYTEATSVESLKYFSEYFSKADNFANLFWGFSDLNTPFSTFITLVKNIPQNMPFDYTAPIKDFSLLIPTVIYPARPLPYNMWYVKIFEPEIFDRGGGLTFYVLGFGYLFAGHVGVFGYLFLFGALFEWLNKLFRMIGGAAGLLLYGYFFVQLIMFVLGYGFTVFVKGLLMDYIAPLFLLFLFTAVLNSLSPKRI